MDFFGRVGLGHKLSDHSFKLLVIIYKVALNIHLGFLFEPKFSIHLGKYPGMWTVWSWAIC